MSDWTAITPDTQAFLVQFEAMTRGVPTAVNAPIKKLREARANGSAALPIVRLDHGVSAEIPGPAGSIVLRTFTPPNASGAYLHFHGGGFVMGGPDQQDEMLDRIARDAGMTVVSAGYRLAPEHPFPAAPDDCLASAHWFLDEATAGAFAGGPLAIGGESAGAYLTTTTLLRLRDEGRGGAFAGVVLSMGAYDLSLTPSARNWGDRYALISTPILKAYIEAFMPGEEDPRSHGRSPLYAHLGDMPPALFTVGTQDPLLDDTLFMAQRWRAAGNTAELDVYPGGIHAFTAFPIAIARQAAVRQSSFLAGLKVSAP